MEAQEKLGDFIRRIRTARKLPMQQLALRARVRKQYIWDLEHNKRGKRMDGLTAAKIAAVLDIPVDEITRRLEKLTDKEQRNYSSYHRVLRSNLRASTALQCVKDLKESIQLLKIAVKVSTVGAKDVFKLLQRLETTTDLLDETLSYRREPRSRSAESEGDDAKFTPTRPVSNAR